MGWCTKENQPPPLPYQIRTRVDHLYLSECQRSGDKKGVLSLTTSGSVILRRSPGLHRAVQSLPIDSPFVWMTMVQVSRLTPTTARGPRSSSVPAFPPQAPFPFPFLISMADSTLFRVGCQVGCFRGSPGSPIPSPFPASRHPPIPSSIHPAREAWGVVGGQYGGGGNYPIFQKIFPLYDVLYVTWACVGGVGAGTPGPSRDRMKPDFS